jgi:hypothetical protein
MLEKLIELLTRLVVAAETIAKAPVLGLPAGSTETASRKRKNTESNDVAKPEEKKEEAAAPKKNPFAEDDETPAVKRTKEEVRKALTDYANATDNDTALKALAKHTSNGAQKIGDIKPDDYNVVFDEISKLIAATKK